MAQELDFYFNYGSTYSYLTIMRIEGLAAQAGIEVHWRPFNVRSIFVEQNNIPFKDKPVKAQYMWRDIERRAALFGLEWRGIPPYPVDRSGLCNRLGAIAADEGWAPAFTRAVYRAWFLERLDFGLPEIVNPILAVLGQDPDAVIRRADGDEGRHKFDVNTEDARKLGVFGAPSFVVMARCSGDMTDLTMH
ncbi:MAG: DsbA oxidoreductase [Herminiimonas sp.]|nr:DsbA oxidoreductase [Herminiimonas sp.]